MAHEELKALYEIDKQHSDTPWEFWEILNDITGVWYGEFLRDPLWINNIEYRRKPDAPVWPVPQKVGHVSVRGGASIGHYWDIKDLPDGSYDVMAVPVPAKQELIQGYTAAQWQTIIYGKFLCEFSDADWHIENNYADRIVQVLTGITDGRFTGNDYHWPYCRPLRIKGVRQPWFGGECPVGREVYVHVTYDNSASVYGLARDMGWQRIIEFIEL